MESDDHIEQTKRIQPVAALEIEMVVHSWLNTWQIFMKVLLLGSYISGFK